MTRSMFFPLIVVPLLGCAEGGTAIGPGGLSAPFRGALVNDEQHFQCEESYDPSTGAVTIKVVHDRGSHVDDTAIHEIAGVAGAAIGIGKTAGAVVGAARGGNAFPSPIPPPLNFPACFGTQSLGYAPPAPPNPTPPTLPNPPPPQQGGQQQPAPTPPRRPASFSPGWHQGVNPDGARTSRLLDHVEDDGGVVYYGPSGRAYRNSARAWLAWAEGGA